MNTCPNCGLPRDESGQVGAAKRQVPAWGGGKPDNAPITPQTSWDDPSPNSGAPWIDYPVKRVLKRFSPNGSMGGEGGWKLLEGWTENERIALVKQWVKATWPTPYAALQTMLDGEEEFEYLFIAWALGWNLSFSGKKLQPCWFKVVDNGGGQKSRVPSGYRWNPFTRSCEKVPSYTFQKGYAG